MTDIQVPPQSRDAEFAVAGDILANGAAGLSRYAGLQPNHFHFNACRHVFESALELQIAGEEIDPISIGGRLEKLHLLEETGGVPALSEMMDAADPRWSDRYVSQIRSLAERRTLRRQLERMAFDAWEQSVNLTDIRAELFDLSKSSEPGKVRFPSLTPAELDRGEFELEYLIEGLLTFGQPCIFAGGKKTLKTNILIDLALSIASGFPFLGKFRVLRTAVVGFISGESGRATIQETARRIARSKGQPLKNFTGVHFCFDLPKLGQPDDMLYLRRWIEDRAIEVLVIDPTYLALNAGDNASNLFAMGEQLAPLKAMMDELGCTLILCHHCRKNGKADPFSFPELEDIAWAGFQEFARQWILVGRREKFDPESAGEHKLWLNAGGSAGHASLWAADITEGRQCDDGGRRWDVSIMRASEAVAAAIDAREAEKESKAERENRKRTAKILATIEKHPEGETKSAIRIGAGIGPKIFNPIFDELLETGEIESLEITKNSRSETGYRRGRTRSNTVELIQPVRPGARSVEHLPPPLGGECSTDRPTGTGKTNGKAYSTCSTVRPSGVGFPPPPDIPADELF